MTNCHHSNSCPFVLRTLLDLCAKLSSAVFSFRRTKAVITKEATVNAYHALFEGHVRYGIDVWDGTSQSNLNRAFLIQKRALKVMAGVGWSVSCRLIFVECELLTVATCTSLKIFSWQSRGTFQETKAITSTTLNMLAAMINLSFQILPLARNKVLCFNMFGLALLYSEMYIIYCIFIYQDDVNQRRPTISRTTFYTQPIIPIFHHTIDMA